MKPDVTPSDYIGEAESGFFARALRTVAARSPDAQEAAAVRFAILLNWGRFSEAGAIAANGLEVDNLSSRARRYLADAALAARITGMAKPLYKGILQSFPDDYGARVGLAKCCLLDGEPQDAVQLAQSVPDTAQLAGDAQDVVGQALLRLGRQRDAESAFRKAIELAPERAAPRANLGILLWSASRVEESIAATHAAFELENIRYQGIRSFKFLGDAYAHLERDDEANTVFASGLLRHPDPEAHRNYCDLLLRGGELPRAYENYEFRWLIPPMKDLRPRSVARPWQCQSLVGKRLLLRYEQGIGDNIQYLRYARHLQVLGAITLIGRFSDIVDCCEGISESSAAPFGEVDYVVDIASLPRLFGTTPETIPSNIPYIRPNAAKVDQWAKRMTGKDGFRVGLVWAGNPQHSRDAERSIALTQLAPIFETPGVDFFSLQKASGSAGESATSFEGVADLGPEFADFGDTAAAIANLDLVICVDTSVAHLAGAIGKETWMLLARPSDPRWMHGDTTPWYPTMKLFRQVRRGEWKDVIDDVAIALRQRAQSRDTVPLAEQPFVLREPPTITSWTVGVTRCPGYTPGLSAVADTRLGLIQYFPDEPVTGDAIAWYGEHLQLQLDILMHLIAPRSIVLEVGAGIGLHVLALAAMVGPEGRVFAYEEDVVRRQVLGQNLAVHKLQHVTIMRRRLGAIAEDESQTAPPSDEVLGDLLFDRLDWIKFAAGARAIEVLRRSDEEIWRLRPKLFINVSDAEELQTLVTLAKNLGYRCWESRVRLYNPENVNGRDGDIFDGRVAIALIAVPEEFEMDMTAAGELDER